MKEIATELSDLVSFKLGQKVYLPRWVYTNDEALKEAVELASESIRKSHGLKTIGWSIIKESIGSTVCYHSFDRSSNYKFHEYNPPAAGNKGYIRNEETGKVLGWIGTDNTYTPDTDIN